MRESITTTVSFSHKFPDIGNSRPNGDFVYWIWAFESPHEVKVLARQTLGEENAPQGHLRLVLLPIVYSAMAQKRELRETQFFQALHRAIIASSYAKYFDLAPPCIQAEIIETEKIQPRFKDTSPVDPLQKYFSIFHGPYDLQKTLVKYTVSYGNEEEIEQSEMKKQRMGYLHHSRSQNKSPTASTPKLGLDGLQELELKRMLGAEMAIKGITEVMEVLKQQNLSLEQQIKATHGNFMAHFQIMAAEIQVLKRVALEAHPSLIARHCRRDRISSADGMKKRFLSGDAQLTEGTTVQMISPVTNHRLNPVPCNQSNQLADPKFASWQTIPQNSGESSSLPSCTLNSDEGMADKLKQDSPCDYEHISSKNPSLAKDTPFRVLDWQTKDSMALESGPLQWQASETFEDCRSLADIRRILFSETCNSMAGDSFTEEGLISDNRLRGMGNSLDVEDQSVIIGNNFVSDEDNLEAGCPKNIAS